MPGPLSLDLRTRVASAYLNSGSTVKEVAKRFGVGEATVKRWVARVRSGEGLRPRKSPGRPREFTAEHDQLLCRLVEAKPDATLGELVDAIGEEVHREFDPETVRVALGRLGYSRKKNGLCRGAK